MILYDIVTRKGGEARPGGKQCVFMRVAIYLPKMQLALVGKWIV